MFSSSMFEMDSTPMFIAISSGRSEKKKKKGRSERKKGDFGKRLKQNTLR